MNRAGRNFVVARQTRKDRQAGCIGGGPGRRPEVIRLQIKNRARNRRPGTIRLWICSRKFIQDAVGLIDHFDMPVAGAVASALYGGVRPYWIRPWHALARI